MEQLVKTFLDEFMYGCLDIYGVKGPTDDELYIYHTRLVQQIWTPAGVNPLVIDKGKSHFKAKIQVLFSDQGGAALAVFDARCRTLNLKTYSRCYNPFFWGFIRQYPAVAKKRNAREPPLPQGLQDYIDSLQKSGNYLPNNPV